MDDEISNSNTAFLSHRIHVWYVYLHLVDIYGNVAKYTINPTGMNKFLWTSEEKTIAILFIGQIHEEAWKLGIDWKLHIYFGLQAHGNLRVPTHPKLRLPPKK